MVVVGLGSIGVRVVERLASGRRRGRRGRARRGQPVPGAAARPARPGGDRRRHPARHLARPRARPGPRGRGDDHRRPGQHRDRPRRPRPARRRGGPRYRSCCGSSTAGSPRTVEASFDFRYVRSPAALAAPWFVGAALGLDVLGHLLRRRPADARARLSVARAGRLDGLAMHELAAHLRVVSWSGADGSLERPPRRDTRLAAGDTAYLVGPYEELLRLLRTDAVADVVWLARRRRGVPRRRTTARPRARAFRAAASGAVDASSSPTRWSRRPTCATAGRLRGAASPSASGPHPRPRVAARGTHHRHRRTPQRGEVDPLQRADQERRPGGELPVRHDRAQRRRGRCPRRAAAEAGRAVRLGQGAARDRRVRGHRRHREGRVRGGGAGQQVPLPHPGVGRDLPGDPGLPRRGRHPRRRRGQPRPTTSRRSRPR